MSRTCATTRWPGRPGIGAPENESGATGLLAGVSGLEVIVGGRACARAGRCGGFDVGALGRDDLNRREVESNRPWFMGRRLVRAFTRKRDYEDTAAFTKNRMAPPRVHDRCSFFLGDYDGVKLSQRHIARNRGFCHILYDSTGS